MSDLLRLQTNFQSYLLNSNEDFIDEVVGSNKASKITRLEVYKTAYYLRLQEALGESYPALRRHLGVQSFDALCIEYINVFPSCYRSIRWYGDQLSLFLKSCPAITFLQFPAVN